MGQSYHKKNKTSRYTTLQSKMKRPACENNTNGPTPPFRTTENTKPPKPPIHRWPMPTHRACGQCASELPGPRYSCFPHRNEPLYYRIFYEKSSLNTLPLLDNSAKKRYSNILIPRKKYLLHKIFFAGNEFRAPQPTRKETKRCLPQM